MGIDQDGEFMLAARHWNVGLQIVVEGARLKLPVQDGKPIAGSWPEVVEIY